MTRSSFRGMGTTVVVHGGPDSETDVRDLFEASEQRFSRFRPDSELSLVNERRQDRTPVSREMQEILTTADDLRRRTGGLVDIGVGGAVRDWGYDDTFDRIAGLGEAPAPQGVGTWMLETGIVRLTGTTQLDLGGIAKGWTCDRAVEYGLADVVSAGGDVRSADPSHEVEIVDENDATVAEVTLGVGALATSSTRRRRWRVGSGAAHHIIDPRTQAPAETPVYAASVIADTAVEAEAGAKAVLLLGVEGLRWAEEQPWIRQAIVRWHDGSVYANPMRRAS